MQKIRLSVLRVRTFMRRLGRWAPFGLPALLIGCTAVPMTSGSALAQDTTKDTARDTARSATFSDSGAVGDSLIGTSADSQLMFSILIAEMAARRGQLDVALDGYQLAYPRSSDPRVAERATRLAIYAQAWDKADGAASYWLNLEPDAGEALELRAQIRLRQGRVAEAANGFAALIEKSSEPDKAWVTVSAVLLSDPDPAIASSVAQALAALSSESPQAQMIVARLALAAGDQVVADEAIERTLELAPDDPDARLMRAQQQANAGDMEAALLTIAEARERSPDNTQLQLGEAQLLIEAGRIEEATSALKLIGDSLLGARAQANPEALLTVGMLSMQVGALDDAERWFTGLLPTGEYPDRARFQLARISDLQGDSNTAIDRYESVPPGDMYVTSQVRAAELRAAEGDLELARERLQILRGNLFDPMLRPQIVATEARMLQNAGEYADAVGVLTSGLDEFPDNSVLLYARALVAEPAGRPELLEQDLQTLISAEPENAHALNALGYHYVDNDIQLDEAALLIEKASELRPDDPAIMDSLGWLRYRQGRNEEAIELLTIALALLPDPEIASHLIEVLWRDGREEEALEVHEEALSRTPDDERLSDLLDVLAQ
jgi:tetratricopeptide (TPR) repeat protein